MLSDPCADLCDFFFASHGNTALRPIYPRGPSTGPRETPVRPVHPNVCAGIASLALRRRGIADGNECKKTSRGTRFSEGIPSQGCLPIGSDTFAIPSAPQSDGKCFVHSPRFTEPQSSIGRVDPQDRPLGRTHVLRLQNRYRRPP